MSRQVGDSRPAVLGFRGLSVALLAFSLSSLARAETNVVDVEEDVAADPLSGRSKGRIFEARHERLNGPIGRAHPWRTIAESAGALAVGVGWYFAALKSNRLDWDNPSLQARLSGDAWRLDNNDFDINFIAHPLTGSAFYVLARVNNLGPYWSYGNAFGFSLLWELGIEFKEKVSINDQLVTPLAGVPIGEFAYRLGRYLSAVNEPSAFQHLLRYTLGLAESYHRHWDGIPARAVGPVGSHGYGVEPWHRLSYGYSLALPVEGQAEIPVHSHRFSGEFVTMPGYRAAGDASRWFHELEFSRLKLAVPISSAGTGVDLDAEVLAAGHYFHRFAPEGKAGVDGLSTAVGINVAYAYRSSSARGWDERLAPLSLPGLGAIAWMAEGPFRFEMRGRVNLDFTGVSALAYPDWLALHQGLRGKSVLRKKGYFYGFGPSTRWVASLSYRDIQIYGGFFFTAVESVEGLDRSQEELIVDEHARTTVTEWEAGVRLHLPLTPLVARAGYRGSNWHSRVQRLERVAGAQQAHLGLEVEF